MSDYDNSNTGVLFKNDKQGNDKRPDYTGTFTDANGHEMRLAAWIRESKSGNKFMSLKVSEKQASQQPQQQSAPVDDDIPF